MGRGIGYSHDYFILLDETSQYFMEMDHYIAQQKFDEIQNNFINCFNAYEFNKNKPTGKRDAWYIGENMDKGIKLGIDTTGSIPAFFVEISCEDNIEYFNDLKEEIKSNKELIKKFEKQEKELMITKAKFPDQDDFYDDLQDRVEYRIESRADYLKEEKIEEKIEFIRESFDKLINLYPIGIFKKPTSRYTTTTLKKYSV
jgi:hypothetical protein